MVSWGVKFPHKNGPIPSWLTPHFITSNPPPNLHALPSPIGMTTMIRQNTKFPPIAWSPGKPDHQAIDCPTSNSGPLLRDIVTNSILITVWYLFNTKINGSLGLSQDPSDSECSALTHFSMNLDRKYVNLKEPYDQDIKEYVTTIVFLKKKTDLIWNPPPQRQSVPKVFFKFNLLFVVC